MLKIIPFDNHISSIYKELDTDKNWTAVTPSPLKSDILREIFTSSGMADISTITISKFIKDNLPKEEAERKSKSELLMELWTLWKLKVSEDFNSFRYSFDLFTEIRSYSLEFAIAEEIKEYIGEETYFGLQVFHQYFESSNVIDEQKSYELVGTNYLGSQDQGFIIWGFDHLNSVQIDMLKSISEKSDVVIPLSKEIFNGLDTFDWPTWLTTNEFKFDEEPSSVKVRAYQVPKGRLSEYLDLIVPEDENYTLIDFNKSAELTQTSSFLRDNLESKTNIDIFSIVVRSIFNGLFKDFNWSEQYSQIEIDTYLEKKQFSFLSDSHMREFKVISELRKLILKFSEYSDANIKLSWSDLLIVREVLGLDLPRTSIVSLVKDPIVRFLSRDSLGQSFGPHSFLFIDSESDKSLRDNSPYSADILSVFSAYGPSQNKKFESMVIAADLLNFVESGGSFIYEEGAFEDSFEWERILKNFELEIIELETQMKKVAPIVEVAEGGVLGKMSATKIQSYLDCPRKYAYEYINRINLLVRAETSITPDLKGIVEHLLIERYCEQNTEYSEVNHRELARHILSEEIKSNNLYVSKLTFDSALEEIIAYTSFITQRLIEIKKDFGAKLTFEYDLSLVDDSVNGRIDLIVEVGGKIVVIDFKRSSFGVPSKKDFEGLSKVQMWFYLKRVKIKNPNLVGMGYISLSVFDESLIYTLSDEVWVERLFDGLKVHQFKSELSDMMNDYDKLEEITIEKMNEDQYYLATPIDLKVCDFCVANSVCTRGDN